MVQSVQCINRYAVSQDATTPQIPQGGAGAPKPSFSSDYYQCSYVPEEKKGSVLGFLAKTVFGLGIVAGALVGARRFIKPLKEVNIDATEVKGFLNNIKHYTAKAGQKIEDYTMKAFNICRDFVTKEKEPPEAKAKPKTKKK